MMVFLLFSGMVQGAGAATSDSITVSGYILPHCGINANFIASPREGPAPLIVQFTDRSIGFFPNTWLWEYRNATVGWTVFNTTQNPVYIYRVAGKYSVRLTVTNGSLSDTKERHNYIHVKPIKKPKADFSSYPRSGVAPLTVQFTDLSPEDPTSWAWDFGDGGHSSEQNPNHTYTYPGNYKVVLLATNDIGIDMVSKPRFIRVSGHPCKADFYEDHEEGPESRSVQFTDLSTCEPTLKLWHFGDGDFSYSFDSNPKHQFAQPGLYKVKLMVTDLEVVDTYEQEISVQ